MCNHLHQRGALSRPPGTPETLPQGRWPGTGSTQMMHPHLPRGSGSGWHGPWPRPLEKQAHGLQEAAPELPCLPRPQVLPGPVTSGWRPGPGLSRASGAPAWLPGSLPEGQGWSASGGRVSHPVGSRPLAGPSTGSGHSMVLLLLALGKPPLSRRLQRGGASAPRVGGLLFLHPSPGPPLPAPQSWAMCRLWGQQDALSLQQGGVAGAVGEVEAPSRGRADEVGAVGSPEPGASSGLPPRLLGCALQLSRLLGAA